MGCKIQQSCFKEIMKRNYIALVEIIEYSCKCTCKYFHNDRCVKESDAFKKRVRVFSYYLFAGANFG